MNIANIKDATEWFEVLQTTAREQTAVMRLSRGRATGDAAESHDKSEQVLLLLEGELLAEIGSKHSKMRAGDVVIIPAGVEHKFTNVGDKTALTFNVYAPPAYSTGEKG